MIVDEGVLAPGAPPYDVAIVGAGAAGLCLAQALARRRGRRILVIEAGGLQETAQGREDCEGEVRPCSPHPALDLYRVRALGGTSRIWGGRCIPFDRIDFSRRPWVAGPGWPVAFEEVACHYPAALALAEAGRGDFDPSTVLPEEAAELVPGLDGGPIRTTLERFSRPTDFWRRLGRALRDAVDVDVLPHTAVTSIRLRPDGSGVRHLVLSPPSGRPCTLRAGRYVLAGGGLEVARLLLASDDVCPAGIGNGGDQLGRNYMSHLCVSAGVLSLARPGGTTGFGYARDADGVYVRRRLWISPEAQRRHGLLNTTFRTSIPEPADPGHRDAVLSAMFLSKRLVQREYAAKFGDAPAGMVSYGRHLANVARQPVALGRFAAHWTARRVLARRKLPSVVRPAFQDRTVLEVHAEQSPVSESRVTLGEERDRFGLRRLRVAWRLAESDVASIQGAYGLLARRLSETGVGRLDVDLDDLGDAVRRAGIVGGHHIGLTRMSALPNEGVVDRDCRVHGTDDLYVASASVLPTSGQANPTLTVLALALRLAEHLDAECVHADGRTGWVA